LIKAGDILIAKPFLQDGHFKRSVIYMCEHNDNGSMGFIINKNHGMVLRDVFPHLKNGNFSLFEGGPVSSNQLFYTHTLGKLLPESIPIKDNVYWGGNFFELCTMIESNKVLPHQIRFYIGYSGWDKQQLNEEIKNDMWFHKQADYTKLMDVTTQEIWGKELIKINSGYCAFANYAFDPSLN
jgi:putative transcriptional regulator